MISCFNEVVAEIYDDNRIHPLRDWIIAEKLAHCEDKEKLCDLLFAEYIVHFSRIHGKIELKEGMKFVILYRDCYNKVIKDRSAMQYGETLPNECNRFLNSVDAEIISKKKAVELTFDFCKWMFANSYTSIDINFK